jgi:putative transposase
MKKSRFSEFQMIKILKEGEAGRSPKDICRENGISQATYYNWKAKYGGMTASSLKRLKELESENTKLKQMYADLSLQNVVLKDVIEKKL